jgi:hypothetical protein
MPTSAQTDFERQAKSEGWTISTTGSGHLRLEHPAADRPVFGPATTSDRRTVQNMRAAMRRALPPEPKPQRTAVERTPRRKPVPARPAPVPVEPAIQRPVYPPRRRPIPFGPSAWTKLTVEW